MPERNNETWISLGACSRLCVTSGAEHPAITPGVIIIPQGFKERKREGGRGGSGGGGGVCVEGGGGVLLHHANRQPEWEL